MHHVSNCAVRYTHVTMYIYISVEIAFKSNKCRTWPLCDTRGKKDATYKDDRQA